MNIMLIGAWLLFFVIFALQYWCARKQEQKEFDGLEVIRKEITKFKKLSEETNSLLELEKIKFNLLEYCNKCRQKECVLSWRYMAEYYINGKMDAIKKQSGEKQ